MSEPAFLRIPGVSARLCGGRSARDQAGSSARLPRSVPALLAPALLGKCGVGRKRLLIAHGGCSDCHFDCGKMSGGYGAVAGTERPARAVRHGAYGAIAAAGLVCVALAVAISSAHPAPQASALQSVVGLRTRARRDLDPGSLSGLEQAAYGGIGGRTGRAATRLGAETEASELERLQELTTTQADRRASDALAPKLRGQLGSTIAKYFSTVRSIKDDQGTFLG